MQINTLWRVVHTLIVTYVISAVLLAALSFALFQFHLREPEVNAAVNAFNRELIASHIRGCVVRDIKNGEYEVIDELVNTLQKLMK